MNLFFDEKLEAVILGAILLESDSIHEISSLLKHNHFYDKNNQVIYKACFGLLLDGKGINPIAVMPVVLAKTKLSHYDVGILTSGVASASHLKTHVMQLIDLYTKRALMTLARDIQKKTNNNEDPTDIMNFIQTAQLSLSDIGNLNSTQHIAECLSAIEKQQVEYYEQEPTNYKTGLKTVDDFLHIEKSDLIIIAARPSVGKTAFAIHLAKTFAKNGKTVCFFSLEMSNLQVGKRIMASEARINSSAFRDLLTNNELLKFEDFKKPLSKLPFYIDDTASLTILTLRSKIIKQNIKDKIDIVFIDYLQLMSGASNRREHVISDISRGLKILAKELNIPIIALSQLNRNAEQRGGDKRPKLADLRESGAIEQDADIVLALNSPERNGIEQDAEGNQFSAGYLEVIVLKQRNGSLGIAEIFFNKECQSFSDTDLTSDFPEFDTNN